MFANAVHGAVHALMLCSSMKLNEIEAFDAVMRAGSTMRAAELLGISQPAISRALARLASSTRLTLFRTIRGRLVPTPEAELFHAEVRGAFAGIDRLKSKAASIREFGSGALRIACFPALGLSFVPKAIRLFREAEPQASVTLNILGSTAVRDQVAEGRYDIGLSADEIDTTHVSAQPFMTPRAVCVMRWDHPLAACDLIRPADIGTHPFIALSPEDTVQRRLQRLFTEAGIEPRIAVETQYSETVCNLALEGVGIGIANAASVRSSGFEQRGLVVKPFEPELSFRALLLTHPTRLKSALAERFLTCLFQIRNQLGAG
jgi:DNA-binding transcriptional LysR family regulator